MADNGLNLICLMHEDSVGLIQIMEDPDKFVQYTLFYRVGNERIETGTINGAFKNDVRLPLWLVFAY